MAVWIKRAKSGRYTVFVKHEGKRSSTTVNTLAEANRLKKDTEVLIQRGSADLEKLGRTFDTVSAFYLSEYVDKQKRSSTAQKYRGLLNNHISPVIGSMPLRKIDRIKIRSLLRDLSRTKSTSVVRSVKDCINAVFIFAANEGYITGDNPTTDATKQLGIERELPDHDLQFFTPEESAAVLGAIRLYRPKMYPLFLLLFRTGMRLGEALALDYEDINYDSGYIVVKKSFRNGVLGKTKTGRIRHVDMSAELTKTIRNLRQEAASNALASGRSETTGPIFLDKAGGRLSQNSVRNVWRRSLSTAGIEYRKVHSIRHTVASYLLAKGADIYYVSKILGHKNIQMTCDTYGHLVPERDRSIMDILDGQFGQENRSSKSKKAL